MGETKQRQMILEVIRDSDEHLTASEIFQLAQQRCQGISRSTVYRNLNILADRRLVVTVSPPDQPTYFDRNIHPHHHSSCVVCGTLCDIPSLPLDVDKLVPNGFEVLSSSFVVVGICEQCREKGCSCGDPGSDSGNESA